MVVASVRKSAKTVTDLLEGREWVAVAALGALGAGGMALGQEIADAVMPMLNRPVDPTSAADLGLSAIVKLLGAMALVAAGAATGGVGLAVAGGLAYGVLVSMGTDLIDVFQRGGLPGTAPARRRSSAPSRVRRARPSASSGRSAATATVGGVDNGAYR